MQQVQKNSFISYILSDQICFQILTNLFQKLHLQIYASQFMTSQIIPLPFVLLHLESVEREKITKV